MQEDLFSRSMDYKHTRDEQNRKMVRLSLLNQGLMMQAIDRLADVLGSRVAPCATVLPAAAPPTTTYDGETEAMQTHADDAAVPTNAQEP